jgi:hypothetical protein
MVDPTTDKHSAFDPVEDDDEVFNWLAIKTQDGDFAMQNLVHTLHPTGALYASSRKNLDAFYRVFAAGHWTEFFHIHATASQLRTMGYTVKFYSSEVDN